MLPGQVSRNHLVFAKQCGCEYHRTVTAALHVSPAKKKKSHLIIDHHQGTIQGRSTAIDQEPAAEFDGPES